MDQAGATGERVAISWWIIVVVLANNLDCNFLLNDEKSNPNE